MFLDPSIDPHHLKQLESALAGVRKAIARIESPQTGKIDFSQWSEAQGSVIGDWIRAPGLGQEHLQNCSLVCSRYDLLHKLQKRGCVAEIGTQFGQFARHIASIAQPARLHLFDLNFKDFPAGDPQFKDTSLIFHEGNSCDMIQQADCHFDWVYLDADHSYEAISKDLQALKEKVVAGGMIICNDYTAWSPLEARFYGVPKAVHEFCLSQGWGFRYLALHPWGYHDVALQRLGDME